MSEKLGIIELLRRVGEDNIRLQNVQGSMTNIQLSKRDVLVTFATSPQFINPNEAAFGVYGHVGLVLWLPTKLVEAAKEKRTP